MQKRRRKGETNNLIANFSLQEIPNIRLLYTSSLYVAGWRSVDFRIFQCCFVEFRGNSRREEKKKGSDTVGLPRVARLAALFGLDCRSTSPEEKSGYPQYMHEVNLLEYFSRSSRVFREN